MVAACSGIMPGRAALRAAMPSSRGTRCACSGSSASTLGCRPCGRARLLPACSLPSEAVQKAVEALKEEHGKPTDREVVTVVATVAAAAVHHSKTAVGYMAHEAPLLTWLPLLACGVAAAAGVATARRAVLWAAVGGAATFVMTIWQVLAPLVRRFQALRSRLVENDQAAKGRLDAAAEQLKKAVCERGQARQEASQARWEVRQLRRAVAQAEAAAHASLAIFSGTDGTAEGELAPGPPLSTAFSSGDDSSAAASAASAGSSAGANAESAGERAPAAVGMAPLQRLLELRRQQDRRLASILNNALNAAAVSAPPGTDEHLEPFYTADELDGYGERPINRNNVVEVAGALQSRVDALRRQAQAAAEKQEELERLQAELRQQADAVAALQAQLGAAKAEARKVPQLKQGLEEAERKLAAQRQWLQRWGARLESAAHRALPGARSTAAEPAAAASSSSGQPGAAASSRGATSDSAGQSKRRPRGSISHAGAGQAGQGAGEGQEGEAAAAARGASRARTAELAAELEELRRKLGSAERDLAVYHKMVPVLQKRLEMLQGQQARLESQQAGLEHSHEELVHNHKELVHAVEVAEEQVMALQEARGGGSEGGAEAVGAGSSRGSSEGTAEGAGEGRGAADAEATARIGGETFEAAGGVEEAAAASDAGEAAAASGSGEAVAASDDGEAAAASDEGEAVAASPE